MTPGHGRAQAQTAPGRALTAAAPGPPSTAPGGCLRYGQHLTALGDESRAAAALLARQPPPTQFRDCTSGDTARSRDPKVGAIKTPLPPAVMTDAAIDRLRRLALRLGKPGDEDGQWFSAAVAEFVAAAPHGGELGDAFGLRAGWWRVEAVERRDRAVREIRRSCFPWHSGRAAAKKISRALDRYQATTWRTDRALMRPVQDDPLRLRLHALLKLKVPCGYSTIRAALVANEEAALLATSSETLPPEDSATEDKPNHAASSDETDKPKGPRRSEDRKNGGAPEVQSRACRDCCP
jgi:hypothetical protein